MTILFEMDSLEMDGLEVDGVDSSSSTEDSSASSDEDCNRAAMAELELSALHKGRGALAAGDCGTAFACYLLVLKVNPGRQEVVVPFASALLQWCRKLVRIGRGSDAVDCCRNALSLRPRCRYLWFAYGSCLALRDMKDDALNAFYTALKLHSSSKVMPCVRWAADNLLHELVERWHFPMLNDIERNARYAAAISVAVKDVGPDANVLEIGSGTGLLSMFALRAGLRCIHAVEMSALMHGVCQKALAANGYRESVHLRCMPSTDLTVPGHLSSRVSLVVTEIMDCALLGEHIVPVLRHAWERLLLPPPPSTSPSVSHDSSSSSGGGGDVKEACSPAEYGRVIPCSANVHAMLMECDAVRHRSRLITNSVIGLDFSRLSVIGSDHVESEAAKDGRLSSVAGCRPLQTAGESTRSAEPYSTEDFSRVRGGARPLQCLPDCPGDDSLLLSVDFNDPKVPVCMKEGSQQFVVDKCGYLDTVAVFFEASLGGGNVLSTNPFRPSANAHCAWQQASFPATPDRFLSAECWRGRQENLCASCRAAEHPVNSVRVCAGDVVSLSAGSELDDTQLTLRIADIHRCRKDGDGASVPLVSPPLADSPQQAEASAQDVPCVFAERAQLARLNDSRYSDAVRKAVRALLARFDHGPRVLDLSTGLPLPGLCALAHMQDRDGSLSVLGADGGMQAAIEILASQHGQSVSFVPPQSDASGTYDIVFGDLITPMGFLDGDALQSFKAARVGLARGGIMCPQRLDVFAMCIDCADLQAQTAVLGTAPTLGIDVARFINHHQVSTFVGLDLGAIRWEKLTEAVRVLEINLDGSALPDLSCESDSFSVQALAAGSITAVVYWFRIYLVDDVSVENCPSLSKSVESHWQHATVLVPDNVAVSPGDVLQLEAQFQNGCLGMCVKKPRTP